MSKRLRLGFVGGGFVGQFAHLNNYYTNPQAHMVAIAEKRPRLRENIKTHFGFEESYVIHSDMLARADIDAVVAITRRPHTGAVAYDVLKAGKHLITEKPMAHTVAQAKLLVDQAKASNVTYAVGYLRRFDAGVQEAKRLFDHYQQSGELGKIISVRAHCYCGASYCGMKSPVPHDEPYPTDLVEWPIGPDWMPKEFHDQYARYVNIFSHNVNLLNHFFPQGLSLEYANFRNPLASLVAFDAGGFLVTLEAGECSTLQWDDTLEIFYERGKLTLKMPANFLVNVPSQVQVHVGGGEREQIISPQIPWSWGFKRQADAFVENILAGRPHPASGAEGLRDLELMEHCWKTYLKIQ